MASSIATSKTSAHAHSVSLPFRSHPTTATAEEIFHASVATQTATLSHVENEKSVEEVLDGSFQLLDACGACLEVLSLMRGGGQELASSLRRRKTGDSGLDTEHECFKSSRKNPKQLLSAFKSPLLVVLGSKSESKSLVSKFIRSKRVACDEEEKMDSALDSLRKSSKTTDAVQVQNLQKQNNWGHLS
ncbi:Protein BPS1, chloroplastic [Dillenia turbinata]|uniref:Protein BPS1, chloroplastic n=1 Tax=Dillenia turbinata TaxID=194707 RepID=A0AAN8VS25_9MAGN